MNMLTVLFLGIGLTIFFGAALLLAYLNARQSALDARLKSMAAEGRGTVDEVYQEPGRSVAATIGDFISPVRKQLGLSTSDDVAQKLAKIGYKEPYHADIYYAAKVIGPMASAVVASTLLKSDPLFWFFLLASVTFFAPDLWLSTAVTRWRDSVRLGLPDALDLLVICMEAGLGLDQALLRVGQELKLAHPALAAEFLQINLEQRAGKRRIEAWRNMAERTGIDIVRAFVNMLLQTERFGTPVAKSLGSFADSLRTRRRQQAEELAAKTTIKLVFPLVFFIFPSMFIVLLAPAIISILHSLGSTFNQ